MTLLIATSFPWVSLIFLAIGLVLILWGANYLVDGSSSIAKKWGLSEFVIGLTIVGIGTSAPEMVVSFIASMKGEADMAIGNIIGSNIINTLLILGVTALISPLLITKDNLKKDIPLIIGVSVLLLALGKKFSLFGVGSDTLTRYDGALLLAIFIWYLWSSFRSKPSAASPADEENEIETYSGWQSILFIVSGLTGLICGGKLFVESASDIAIDLGISQKFIAITVMALGTSLPELATCIVAALKGRGQLALGNIIGSNISNIILILGGAALISPLSFNGISPVDSILFLVSAIVIFITAFTFVKNKIDRVEGAILLAMEAGYLWYLIQNL